MTKIVNGFRCSICDEEFQGFGNNASPFKGVCCDECNGMHVIPARMAMMFGDRPPYEVPSGGSIKVTMGEPKPLGDQPCDDPNCEVCCNTRKSCNHEED